MKLTEHLKAQIKHLTPNCMLVLRAETKEAAGAARALAQNITAYTKAHGIGPFFLVITSPAVSVSVFDEHAMRQLGWVRAPAELTPTGASHGAQNGADDGHDS